MTLSYTPTNCNCPATNDGPTLAGVCGGNQLVLFMGLFEALLRTQCDIEQPCNRPKVIKSIVEPRSDYDFIVVGGGSGGSVMAARLSEVADWRVLLIELGGHEPVGLQVPAFCSLYLDAFHAYATEPNHRSYLGSPGNRSEPWRMARMLGGLSAMNGMSYLRGMPAEFEAWQRMGNEGWSWQDVLPYFRKAEDLQPGDPAAVVDGDLHGRGGPMPVTPATLDTDDPLVRGLLELGLRRTDLNGHNATGFDAQSTTRHNVRYSTAKAYLWPVANRRPNLDIWLHTRATRILLASPHRRRRAYGVEVTSAGRTWRVRARKEVIVSAGTVESPKLLLLSGIGRAAELRRVGVRPLVESPGVGRNLHGHVGMVLAMQSAEENRFHMNWAMASEYLAKRSGTLGVPARSFSARIASRYAPSADQPDLHWVMATDFANNADRCSLNTALNASSSPAGGSLQPLVVGIVLHPQSRGRISLASADPLRDPRIYPNDFGCEADVDRLVDCMQRIAGLLDTDALRRAGVTALPQDEFGACGHLQAGTAALWRCRIRHGAFELRHPAGTCAMGRRPGDRQAVLDAQLRVRGVRALRVVDASAMPAIVSGMVAVIVMMAEKTADVVKREYGGEVAELGE